MRTQNKIRSVEDMAKDAIDLYYQPSFFIPEGLPFAVAQKKAAANNPTLASVIMRLTENDLK